MTKRMEVGARVCLVEVVDHYSTIWCPVGETGTVVRVDDENTWVKLDRHFSELDMWDNELQVPHDTHGNALRIIEDEPMGMVWEMLHPEMTSWHLGELPGMLDPKDPRPAREQFDAHYQHGGGWRPFKGHTLNKDLSLSYPGDPPMPALARTKLRDEVIILSECSWVTIVQPDGSHETCRMD